MSRLETLQALLYQEVPLTRQMEIKADEYDGKRLTLTAALQPNINIHGTAFGGSMYSLAAVTAWGLLRLKLEDAGLSADVMLGSATIDYLNPIREDLIAIAELDESLFKKFTNDIRQGKRAKIEINVTLDSTNLAVSQPAARYNGVYATV